MNSIEIEKVYQDERNEQERITLELRAAQAEYDATMMSIFRDSRNGVDLASLIEREKEANAILASHGERLSKESEAASEKLVAFLREAGLIG